MSTNNELVLIDSLSAMEITPATLTNEKFMEDYSTMMYYIQRLQELKETVDAKIKESLEVEYVMTGNQTVNNGKFTYTFKPETTRESFDSKKLKEENPDLYKNYVKISNVKSSIVVKEIKEK